MKEMNRKELVNICVFFYQMQYLCTISSSFLNFMSLSSVSWYDILAHTIIRHVVTTKTKEYEKSMLKMYTLFITDQVFCQMHHSFWGFFCLY